MHSKLKHMDKVKVTKFINKISDDRNDSFWYFGDQIATLEYQGKKLSVEARGEIRVQFEKNGDHFKNDRAVEEAINMSFTDKQLAKLNNIDGWHNNNWFAITEIDSEGNIGDDIDIAHTYDEAMNVAQEIILGGY